VVYRFNWFRFQITRNKSTETELCAHPCPFPVSSSTHLDAPGVHSLAGYVAIPPRALSDRLLSRNYGLCPRIRTGPRVATALILRTRTLSDMGALDSRLYTSPHSPTDSVSQLEPDCVKLVCTGCWSASAARLSLLRYCTHNPHPCTVLTATHNLHTLPPDAPA